MPISKEEWTSIRTMIERMMAGKGEYFITSKVVKRDVNRKLVWIAELGDQPIPLVAFDYEVRYYDENSTGQSVTISLDIASTPYSGSASGTVPSKTKQKFAKVSVEVPKVGQLVLVARELGTDRIPRCLGVIMGKGWITPES